jgi:hypothetical protein
MNQKNLNAKPGRDFWKGPMILLMLLFPLLSSCELIGDIFKAGVWVGVLLVVVVVGLIIFIVARLLGGGGGD